MNKALAVFYPSQEKHTRSMTKSICWRILGVILLAFITYCVTREWITTTAITFTHHGVFIFIYYLHERFWLKTGLLRDSKWKPIARVITYEVILGNLILATISYGFTGSLQQMSMITFIYIGNKYWIYVVFDKIWGNWRWQTK